MTRATEKGLTPPEFDFRSPGDKAAEPKCSTSSLEVLVQLSNRLNACFGTADLLETN
jgi:hypothetical protein